MQAISVDDGACACLHALTGEYNGVGLFNVYDGEILTLFGGKADIDRLILHQESFFPAEKLRWLEVNAVTSVYCRHLLPHQRGRTCTGNEDTGQQTWPSRAGATARPNHNVCPAFATSVSRSVVTSSSSPLPSVLPTTYSFGAQAIHLGTCHNAHPSLRNQASCVILGSASVRHHFLLARFVLVCRLAFTRCPHGPQLWMKQTSPS